MTPLSRAIMALERLSFGEGGTRGRMHAALSVVPGCAFKPPSVAEFPVMSFRGRSTKPRC